MSRISGKPPSSGLRQPPRTSQASNMSSSLYLPGRFDQVRSIARRDHPHQRVDIDHSGFRLDLADRPRARDGRLAQRQAPAETILVGCTERGNPAPLDQRPGNALARHRDAQPTQDAVVLLGPLAVLGLGYQVAAALVFPDERGALEPRDEEGGEDTRTLGRCCTSAICRALRTQAARQRPLACRRSLRWLPGPRTRLRDRCRPPAPVRYPCRS